MPYSLSGETLDQNSGVASCYCRGDMKAKQEPQDNKEWVQEA